MGDDACLIRSTNNKFLLLNKEQNISRNKITEKRGLANLKYPAIFDKPTALDTKRSDLTATSNVETSSFPGEQCETKTETKTRLVRHVMTVHNKIMRFEYELC